MRVFISSTCYDLIDVRAELAEHLRAIGITPVLSDDKLSDFRVHPDRHSIETCLANVRNCDEFILILDKRYGSILEKIDETVSATHLEYQCAKKEGKPIRVYVRDRLEADYCIWKKNDRQDKIKLSWVTNSKDKGLFKLLDEHAELSVEANSSNWYSTFISSIDLKATISKHFEHRILPERLLQKMENNNFPLMGVDVTLNEIDKHEYQLCCIVTNVSNVPAFNLRVYWEIDENNPTENKDIFPAGRMMPINYVWKIDAGHQEVDIYLIIEYESFIGISVVERLKIVGRYGCINGKEVVLNGVDLVDKKYRRSKGVALTIEE